MCMDLERNKSNSRRRVLVNIINIKEIENIDWLVENGHFYTLDKHDSEEIASFVHYFLSVTPYAIK